MAAAAIILQTERLTLRRPSLDDFEDLVRMHDDLRVMKTLGGRQTEQQTGGGEQLAKPRASDDAKGRDDQKATQQQHGNEPSGKEAALELVDGPPPGGRAAEAWFYEQTEAGRTVMAARQALAGGDDVPFPVWFYMAAGVRG